MVFGPVPRAEEAAGEAEEGAGMAEGQGMLDAV